MRKCSRNWLAAFGALLLAGTAHAQVAEPADYATVLPIYWKWAPPESYEPFRQDYSRLFGDTAGATKKNEFDTSTAATMNADSIAKAVNSTDANTPLLIESSTTLGEYDMAGQAFAFRPFSPTTVLYPAAPHGPLGALPNISLRFLNSTRMKSVPMPTAAAKAFLTSHADRRVGIEVTFLPTEAKPASKELRGFITQIRITSKPLVDTDVMGSAANYMQQSAGVSSDGDELAVLNFSPDSGALVDAQYTGTSPQ